MIRQVSFKNFTEPDATLVFIYNVREHEVFFTTLPLEDFFEVRVNWQQPFPFRNPDHPNGLHQQSPVDLEENWRRCLLLKEKETSNFSWVKTSNDGESILFKFDAWGVHPADSPGAALVLFAVKKNKQGQPVPISGNSYRKDYAEFIEIAAHDLDSPLRKLSLLVDRIIDKNHNGQINDLQGYFDRMQSGIREMRFMIDQLTNWASGTELTNPVECDLNDMLENVLNELQRKHENKKIETVIKALPSIEADPEQMKQLFSQLVENAIRFSKKEGPVQLTVTGRVMNREENKGYDLDTGQTYIYLQLADRGIGFRPEFSDRIFKPFQRLHGKSEYPGAGMGLSICKKIVENHGGIIYADSKENEGATFSLILPQCHLPRC